MGSTFDVGTLISTQSTSSYRELIDDLLRVTAIHVVVHMMFVADSTDTLADRRVVSLFLYTILGVAFYHLILRRILVDRVDANTAKNAP